MTRHWISCNQFTVRVVTDDDWGKIIEAAPIVRKFLGQPVIHLVRWAKTFGGLVHEWEESDGK